VWPICQSFDFIDVRCQLSVSDNPTKELKPSREEEAFSEPQENTILSQD
jgi:hypothetical protein